MSRYAVNQVFLFTILFISFWVRPNGHCLSWVEVVWHFEFYATTQWNIWFGILLCFVMSFDIILERCCERMDVPVAHVVHVLQFLSGGPSSSLCKILFIPLFFGQRVVSCVEETCWSPCSWEMFKTWPVPSIIIPGGHVGLTLCHAGCHCHQYSGGTPRREKKWKTPGRMKWFARCGRDAICRNVAGCGLHQEQFQPIYVDGI